MMCGRITAACVSTVFAVFASGITAEAAEIITVPAEEGVSLADTSGRMYVHLLSSGMLNITVDKTEPEGIFCYYDAELVNESSSESAVYQMELSSCEYLVDTGKYASEYAITFYAGNNEAVLYKAAFSIKDPDFETVSSSEIHFYITMEAAAANGFQLLGDIEYEDDDNVLVYEHHLLLQYAEMIQGDADEDGKVTIADATAVLTCYAMKSAGLESSVNAKAADINGDGEVRLNDASAILTYYAMNASGMNHVW